MEIAAGQFKAKCLKLMDQIQQTREEIVITKRGQPVAKLVPLEQEAVSPLLGYMQDTVTVTGDILAPIDEPWDAAQDV